MAGAAANIFPGAVTSFTVKRVLSGRVSLRGVESFSITYDPWMGVENTGAINFFHAMTGRKKTNQLVVFKSNIVNNRLPAQLVVKYADGFEHQFAPNQNHTQLLQEFHPIIVEHEPPPDKVEEESIKKKRKKGK